MARRFQFRLATVLRVRAVREREAKRRVAEKWAEIARLDALTQQTYAELDARQETLRKTQHAAGLDLQELARQRAWIAHLRKMQWERQNLRRRLLEQLRELQAQLAAARTQTRVIEKLKERNLAAYRAALGKHEQSQSEQLAQHLHALDER